MKTLPYLSLLVFSLLLILLSACSPDSDHAQESEPGQAPGTLISETQFVFGTLVDISVWLPNPDQKAAAEQAISEVMQDFDFYHQAWHAWQPGPMGRTNQLLKTGGKFSANPSLLPLLAPSKKLSQQSQGLFNPAIGELVALWGFHSGDTPQGPPPSQSEIQALVDAAPSLDDVGMDGLQMYGVNPALKLDFGAFAKGFAVDLAVNYLNQQGFANVLVNAGGDLRSCGSKGSTPWHIGIRNPLADSDQQIIASIEVPIGTSEGIFTSGNYERYYDHQGTRYHHIIDPRSGYPASGTRSVTIIHPNAATADAAATALFIAGPEQWASIARSMGINKVMLIADDGRVYITPLMQQRINWQGKTPDSIQIVSVSSGDMP